MRSPTKAATATVVRRDLDGRARVLEVLATLPVRIVAHRNDLGAIYIQHVYFGHVDVFANLTDAQATALFDQVATAFDADDVEANTVADAKRVGRL